MCMSSIYLNYILNNYKNFNFQQKVSRYVHQVYTLRNAIIIIAFNIKSHYQTFLKYYDLIDS